MPSWQSQLVRRASFALLRAAPRPDPDQIGIEDVTRIREGMERMARFVRVPADVSVDPIDADGVCGEWVTAATSDPDRVVLYLHGGAFCMGSPATHRGLTSMVAQVAQARVFVARYRLAPEHPYPAALEDAQAAYCWLLDQGVSPDHIAIAGDSAGGGLAVQLLVALRGAGDPLPAAAGLMSPWVDLTGSGDSLQERNELDPWLDAELMHLPAEAYAGDLDPGDPRVSPLFADLAGLPPLLVHVGTDEIIHDDGVRLVERARAAGVDASVGIWKGLWHVFHAFPGLPERRDALREIGGFVRRHTTDDVTELFGRSA